MTTNNIGVQDQAKLERIHAFQLHSCGDYVGALKLYNKSIELYPTAEAFCFKGFTLSCMKKYDEAIQCCLDAIDLESDYGNPYNDIGAYYIQLRQFDLAQIWLERAMKATNYKTPWFPLYNLGRIFERRGDWFQARDYYMRALDLNPDFILAKDAYYKILGLLN